MKTTRKLGMMAMCFVMMSGVQDSGSYRSFTFDNDHSTKGMKDSTRFKQQSTAGLSKKQKAKQKAKMKRR